MANPAPGFRDRPDHAIALGTPTGRVAVRGAGQGPQVAHSATAVRLDEQGYPHRYYVPRSDVAEGALDRSEKTTECPFKGTATYYHVTVGGTRLENAAWSYEQPFDEMARIAGHVAFDHDGLEVLAFETTPAGDVFKPGEGSAL